MSVSISSKAKTPLFSHHFSSLKDPRRTSKGHFCYPLEEILFLVISAVVSGMDSWVDISLFGETKLPWLRKYFPYKSGTPSHDVLGRVFSMLDSDQFSQCFTNWVNEISLLSDGEVVSIDGKTLRGSSEKSSGRPPYHLVSAYACENRVCLGQCATSQKSNEITAIPALLEVLAVTGCMVTIDAMGCQSDIADKVLEKEADYLLMVKGNQKELKAQVEKMFAITNPCDTHESIDSGHGRVEKRTCEVIDKLEFFDKPKKWHHIKALIRVKSERHIKQSGATTHQTRYFICSTVKKAEKMSEAVRQHWSIENQLHWSLDVIFKEDQSLKKKDNAPINFNLVSKVALTLIQREKTPKMSKPGKRKKAALDDNFRHQIIFS